MIIPNIWENQKWQPNHQPVIDWFGKAFVVKTARISTCCPASDICIWNAPDICKKIHRHMTSCHREKQYTKGPAIRFKPKPKNTQTNIVEIKTKVHPTKPKKNIPKPLASSLPGPRRLAHPRLAQTANTAALLQPGLVENPGSFALGEFSTSLKRSQNGGLVLPEDRPDRPKMGLRQVPTA